MADNEQLLAEINVGGLPGGNNVPPTPGRVVAVRALGATEYVAGRPYNWYQQIPRALPWSLDDIARDFGADIYDRMLLDPQVRSVINVLKSSVLETAVTFEPAVTDKGEDGYDQAKQLADDAARMFDDLEVSLDDVLWNMLDAVATGYKIAEQVYGLETTPSGKRRYTLTSLDVKPRESLAFVCDAYYHVLGFLARIPGQALSVQQGMWITDPGAIPNMLPRAKFAALSFRPQENDPRGTSVLRPAWNPWNLKQQIQREWIKYLVQFASPSLIGYTADGAQPTYLTNPETGDPLVDPVTHMPIARMPEDDMVRALEAFANGTAAAFPFGAAVQLVQVAGDGEAFMSAYSLADRQIAKAVLHQTLATEEGEHQTRASSGTHKDILDTVVLLTKRPVERMLRRQIMRTWLTLNGQDKFRDLLPRPSLGETENEDISRLMGAVAALYAGGYIHSSQVDGIDRLLRLPKRNPLGSLGIHQVEQISIKEDAGAVDPPDPDAVARSSNRGPSTKKVKNPSAMPANQAGAGDLSAQGNGRGGTGA